MRERRRNERYKVDANVLVFTENEDLDFAGEVVDINEESIGMRFAIPKSVAEMFSEQSTVRVQLVDTYLNGSSERTDVVQACALIKRTDISENGCSMGCMISDEGFRRYAARRMLEKYYM